MATSLNTLSALSLFVNDVQRSKKFYVDTFGIEVAFEDDSSATLKFENTFVNLLKEENAHELVAPEVVATREGGVRTQLSVWVEDVDAVAKQLAAAGLRINGPQDQPWGMRTLTFSDPDGHNWEIAAGIEGDDQ